MKKVFLGIGTNLGERETNLKEAVAGIEENIGHVLYCSSLYESEPWGFKSDNQFLNMVVVVETKLTASGVLGAILMIEAFLGRTRGESRGLITFVKDRPGHDRRYAIDAAKIRRDLSWEPSYTFESGIQETIDWYLANSDWVAHVTSGEYQRYYEKQYGDGGCK